MTDRMVYVAGPHACDDTTIITNTSGIHGGVYYAGETKPHRPRDLPQDRIMHLTLKRDISDRRDYLLSQPRQALPTQIDYTKDMTPVKDQRRLGSCVAFAACAMKEWQERKEHRAEVAEGKDDHRDGKIYDLSEQWIYYMCKKIDPWPNQEGTSIRYAMKVLNKIGVPTEKGWPYNDLDVGKPKSWAKLVARWALGGSYYRVSSMAQLRKALTDMGPIPIGVGVYEEFFFVGKDGIVADPRRPHICYGGHAICAVGYDDRRGLVKFKNSWGPRWGQNGYGYLSYRYITNYMWDAWACNDISVTTDMLKGKYVGL
ncbi:MAG: hypothetical protein GF411_14385 [Candidatus Lokiarchaeota archaeon]|nr:hypothetical protein [Candidatus Lokiarchaeota archaeon]